MKSWKKQRCIYSFWKQQLKPYIHNTYTVAMNLVPTLQQNRLRVPPTRFEDIIAVKCTPLTNCPGLINRYSTQADDQDGPLCVHTYGPGHSSTQGNVEFSEDNQAVVYKYLLEQMAKKERIVIMEIGVHRNTYNKTSTSIFLDYKRPQDVYIGIDIDDKSFLNDPSRNIHTLKTPSEDIITVLTFLKEKGVDSIDIFMVDGWHSINQVYKEWEYTAFLASKGVVLFHDTNAHPGPYFILQSIDTNMYDVYKYLSDIYDWGIGAAVKKV